MTQVKGSFYLVRSTVVDEGLLYAMEEELKGFYMENLVVKESYLSYFNKKQQNLNLERLLTYLKW